MKAFALRRTGGAPAVVDLPVPEPGPGEVLVRTTAALVCAWEGHTGPGALGHEAVGVVEAVGPGVPARYTGRRVGVEGHGRLAEFFRAPAPGDGLVPLPGSVSDHQALYATGALATGFGAAEAAGAPPGGTVAVFGQGAVGLGATVTAARLRGARIIAVEPEAKRQRLALRFGADVVVDPAYEDAAERLLELTGGAGADCATSPPRPRARRRRPAGAPPRGPGSRTPAAGHGCGRGARRASGAAGTPATGRPGCWTWSERGWWTRRR